MVCTCIRVRAWVHMLGDPQCSAEERYKYYWLPEHYKIQLTLSYSQVCCAHLPVWGVLSATVINVMWQDETPPPKYNIQLPEWSRTLSGCIHVYAGQQWHTQNLTQLRMSLVFKIKPPRSTMYSCLNGAGHCADVVMYMQESSGTHKKSHPPLNEPPRSSAVTNKVGHWFLTPSRPFRLYQGETQLI